MLPTCLALYMEKHGISSKNRRKVYQIEKQSKLKWAPGKCQSIISSKNNDYRSGLTSKTGSPFRLGGGETFPNFCCCLFFFGEMINFWTSDDGLVFFSKGPRNLKSCLRHMCVFSWCKGVSVMGHHLFSGQVVRKGHLSPDLTWATWN